MEIKGWLFDLYHLETSMVLWIKTEDGSLMRLKESFCPRFYAKGKKKDLVALFSNLEKRGWVKGYEWTEKKDFWNGERAEVLEMEVTNGDYYLELPKVLPPWEERITFYNCDIPLAQLYLYEKGLFPTGRCIAEVEGDRVFEIHPDPSESIWEDDGWLPEIRVMELSIFNHNGSRLLLLECEGYRLEMEEMDLSEIHRFLSHFDPDLILSDHGDSLIFPRLFSLERCSKISISWDRDPSALKRSLSTAGRSYFSYGRTYYQASAYPLFGRWHIDRKNSFIYQESGMEGVIELSRLAKIPVQRMARTSPGTAITSMQLDRAFQEGILIPWRKGEPEQFKTAWDLLVTDKGGLVFQPKVGIFEDVAEIDFSSMYPTIMAIHNISPETILCSCCKNHRVPETGYTICERREGIVPKTIRPILIRRAWLKEKIKELETSLTLSPFLNRHDVEKKQEIYNRKQTALKWMLVTCFGYLGYRNARFGKIEAHEAVSAFGREKLLQAKEICEERGFELLHAITDSLWIHKEGLSEEDVMEVCKKITEATGIPMALEGIYRWMVFVPSKQNPERPVANRYFGLFKDGRIKARGLSFRRSDIPQIVQEVQVEMLEILRKTKDIKDYRSKIPEILDILLNYSLMLKEGRTSQEELAIKKRISKEPYDYRVDSLTAIAAQQLEDAGIEIHPGERISYLIKDAMAKCKDERVKSFPLVGPDDTYDTKKYMDMLLKATEEILIHFGYDEKRLSYLIR